MEIRYIPHAQKECIGDIQKHQSHSLYHGQALLFERHNTVFQIRAACIYQEDSDDDPQNAFLFHIYPFCKFRMDAYLAVNSIAQMT